MLTYLYTRLRLSLARLALVALLEKHDRGLEALSEDLGLILKANTGSEAYKASAMIDYLELVQVETDLDLDREEILAEFDELLKDIELSIRKYDKTMPRLRAIHLEFPNLLILEYAPLAISPATPKFLLRESRQPRRVLCSPLGKLLRKIDHV